MNLQMFRTSKSQPQGRTLSAYAREMGSLGIAFEKIDWARKTQEKVRKIWTKLEARLSMCITFIRPCTAAREFQNFLLRRISSEVSNLENFEAPGRGQCAPSRPRGRGCLRKIWLSCRSSIDNSNFTNRRNPGSGRRYRLLIFFGVYKGKDITYSEFKTIPPNHVVGNDKRLLSGVFVRQRKNPVVSQIAMGARLIYI